MPRGTRHPTDRFSTTFPASASEVSERGSPVRIVGPATVKAVAFDVGEVLVDETREYGTWADWLGGAAIACRVRGDRVRRDYACLRSDSTAGGPLGEALMR